MDNINNIFGIIGGVIAGAISVASFASTYYRRNCSNDLEQVIPSVRIVDVDDVVNNRDNSFTTIIVENHHHKME